jgi:PAS domain S-box-containing protein
MDHAVKPTDVEEFFDRNDIIVSKTDLKGRITYANQTFCHIAGLSEAELMGQPHSIIRHPDMPRAVFKLL